LKSQKKISIKSHKKSSFMNSALIIMGAVPIGKSEKIATIPTFGIIASVSTARLALLKLKETLLLCHCERSLRSAAISSLARGDRHAEKASARDDMTFFIGSS